MFWLSEEPLSCTVTLHWHREESSSPSEPAEETVVEGALWRQVGKLHYLSYLEPSEENDGASENSSDDKMGDRTTLKLEPARLTLIRQGSVRWNAVFEAGREHHSAMIVGGTSLPVETRTKALAIDIQTDGGSVTVDYELRIGDWPQHVRLQVKFHRDRASFDGTHQEV